MSDELKKQILQKLAVIEEIGFSLRNDENNRKERRELRYKASDELINIVGNVNELILKLNDLVVQEYIFDKSFTVIEDRAPVMRHIKYSLDNILTNKGKELL